MRSGCMAASFRASNHAGIRVIYANAYNIPHVAILPEVLSRCRASMCKQPPVHITKSTCHSLAGTVYTQSAKYLVAAPKAKQ